MHTINLTAEAASEAGALDGYKVTCSCGWHAASSIRSMALDWADRHVLAQQPTKADFIAVGKYVKETDPAMVNEMRRDGYRTGAESIGRYVYEVNDETFLDALDHINGEA